ncbi:L,D-transpeptidase [Bifidobacterium simiarum]|uniref:L,D-transpeptidase n=1 Tax=Bifidobacterium simiarum TaxID=2045441 RepID=UPI001BDCDC9A|nr:L,D-transpeptidase [Bifidobacterium simiarum]MBT1166668.1 L,D-transpeptidase [Bifidobacterium simiarum]
MASSQDERGREPRLSPRKARRGLTLFGSFLRLFNRPTRALIVSCLIVIVIALCVIVPKGSDELMYSAAAQQSVYDGGTRPAALGGAQDSAGAGPTADGTPARGVKHVVSPPAANVFRKWREPSGGSHIDLAEVRDLHVRVSIADQKVYVMSGDDVVYTMICSTGMDNSTPRGEFTIQNRGEDFFNEHEDMGANYWVSWANYGEYLFHTVPTDRAGRYIVPEAEKLGRPASHGCVRLTVADARWLYEQLPRGTHVTIA